jgi:hypothetical protein
MIEVMAYFAVLLGLPRKRKQKVFFFEKKKQKTFAHAADARFNRANGLLPAEAKVFWFFFSEKNGFLA